MTNIILLPTKLSFFFFKSLLLSFSSFLPQDLEDKEHRTDMPQENGGYDDDTPADTGQEEADGEDRGRVPAPPQTYRAPVGRGRAGRDPSPGKPVRAGRGAARAGTVVNGGGTRGRGGRGGNRQEKILNKRNSLNRTSLPQIGNNSFDTDDATDGGQPLYKGKEVKTRLNYSVDDAVSCCGSGQRTSNTTSQKSNMPFL